MYGLIGSGIQSIFSIINSALTNRNNRVMQRETNQANREMVESQNQAAAAESRKAYERSKASNQVGLLRAAGMSQAGAINTLNGGGSYTPAPVNVSQDKSPQDMPLDMSGFASVAQAMLRKSEFKHAEKMAKMQFNQQSVENAKDRENAKDIAAIQADSSKYGADKSFESNMKSLGFEREKWDFLKDSQKAQLNASINNMRKDGKIKDAELKKMLYDIEEYQSKQNRDARDAETLLRSINAKSNYQMTYKSFIDYRERNYKPIYYNGEIVAYEPRNYGGENQTYLHALDRFWEVIASVIPIDYLARIVKSIF